MMKFRKMQKKIEKIISEGGKLTRADGKMISVYSQYRQYGFDTPSFCITEKEWEKLEKSGWGNTGIHYCPRCGMVYNQHLCNIFRRILHRIKNFSERISETWTFRRLSRLMRIIKYRITTLSKYMILYYKVYYSLNNKYRGKGRSLTVCDHAHPAGKNAGHKWLVFSEKKKDLVPIQGTELKKIKILRNDYPGTDEKKWKRIVLS